LPSLVMGLDLSSNTIEGIFASGIILG